MAAKATPKSCSCRQCTYSKHTTAGNKQVKREERAFRHRSNQQVRHGGEDVLPAGVRSYSA